MITLLAAALLTPPQTKPQLMVGSKAPPIAIKKWLKGAPITKLERDKVYLVEFWATWCGPCLNGMKHLTKLQKKYGPKGLTVISVIAEDKWGNDLPNIARTLKTHQDKIGYTIALDTPTARGYQNVFAGKTFWSYMGAAQVQAIPTSFLIDRSGKVAFIGLPTVAEQAIQEAVAGTIDIPYRARAYAQYKAAEGKSKHYFQLLKDGKEDEAYALARQLVDGPFKYDARMQWLIGNSIVDVLDKRKARDLELAERCINMALNASGGEDVNMRGSLACLRYQKGEKESAKTLLGIVINECAHPAEKQWMQKRLAIMEKNG
jgi:thiol-disulfide isomerase/thioredoxin